jgi:hypothetical protein
LFLTTSILFFSLFLIFFLSCFMKNVDLPIYLYLSNQNIHGVVSNHAHYFYFE